MKKILIIFLLPILLLSACAGPFAKKDKEVNVENMTTKAAEVMLLYADNLMMLDDISTVARSMNREEFLGFLDNFIGDWETLDELSAELVDIASQIEKEQAAVPWDLVSPANAYYDKQAITDIYDNAPKGKGVRTLAEKLNVSAKQAFKILQMSQEQLKAEAWNQAADKIETIENGTKAVKNACKVGLYVGGAALTGGATGVIGQAGAIVSGADLVLEIGEDSANAYFGYNNDITPVFTDMRNIIAPGVNILGLMNLSSGDTLSNLETFVFRADQLNSAVQDSKVLGFELNASSRKAELAIVDKGEINKYLQEKGLDTTPAPAEVKNMVKRKVSEIKKSQRARAKKGKGDAPGEGSKSEQKASKNLAGTAWIHDNPGDFYSEIKYQFSASEAKIFYTEKTGKKSNDLLPYYYENGQGTIGDPGEAQMEMTVDGNKMNISMGDYGSFSLTKE